MLPYAVRYYVLADDGQKYGPADIATLNAWIADNRLLPTQMLEEEASGVKIAARAVAGLNFPTSESAATPPPPAGTPYAGYYRGTQEVGDDGSKDVMVAWIMFGVSFISCCFVQWGGFVIPAVGTYYANRARNKGHQQGTLTFVLNLIWLVILVLLCILVWVFGGMVKNSEFFKQLSQS